MTAFYTTQRSTYGLTVFLSPPKNRWRTDSSRHERRVLRRHIPASSVVHRSSGSDSSQKGVILRFLTRDGWVSLPTPLVYDVHREDGMWVGESERIGLWAGANSHDGVLTQLQEELAVLWEHIALSDDSLLDPNAQLLKRELLALAGRRG